MRFVLSDLRIRPLTLREFCESHVLFMGMVEILPAFCKYVVRFGCISAHQIATKPYGAILSFVKIGSRKVILLVKS